MNRIPVQFENTSIVLKKSKKNKRDSSPSPDSPTSSVSTSSTSSSNFDDLLLESLSPTDLAHPHNADLVARLKYLLNQVPSSHSHPHHNLNLNGQTSIWHSGSTNPCCASGSCTYDLQRVIFSTLYLLCVGFITAYVMAVVHDRVPDPTNYPPLPDLVLDNLPHIHWAFELAELMILTFGVIFSGIFLLHRHRWIVVRRFTAITGTVFLLRCVTMLVTSLSVPGAHLKCDVSVGGTHEEKLQHAWKIISHLALSVSGVRTCGDYMFSGHTCILTIMNYFIQDYTPSSWKGLHTFSWLLNCFGMFFILAGHEHYSIDVFIAFYISSRLFLYYHSLANAQAIRSVDGERVRGFFPMFSYLEECTTGMVPNVYEWPWVAIKRGYSSLFTTNNNNNNKVKKKS